MESLGNSQLFSLLENLSFPQWKIVTTINALCASIKKPLTQCCDAETTVPSKKQADSLPLNKEMTFDQMFQNDSHAHTAIHTPQHNSSFHWPETTVNWEGEREYTFGKTNEI